MCGWRGRQPRTNILKMSKPKHQHFIPKSYLKNFSLEKEDKFFVEAKLKDDSLPMNKLISIRNICVDKNLYTIPHIETDDKYAIEKYYASHIDGIYPDVYKMLVDPSKEHITKEERSQILRTTMSLFFRTPKFLNNKERKLNIVLDFAVRNHNDGKGNVKFKFKDWNFDFHISNLEEVRTRMKIQNKLKFLQEHLGHWREFVEFKSSVGLSVYHVHEDTDLITSDNPVVMHSVAGNDFDVFDPSNIISLPIDNKHFLTIFPNTEPSMTDRIFRGERDKWFALSMNRQVDENSEDWIIGKPGTIKAHLSDQVKYNEETEENFNAIDEIKERAFDLKDLMDIVNEYGTFGTQKVANKMKELMKKEIHQKDPDMKKLIEEIKRYGFEI